MTEMLAELSELLAKGGFVAPPLVLGAFALWWALGYRFILLFFTDRRPARELVLAAMQGRLTEARGTVAAAAIEGARLVKADLPNIRRFLDEVLDRHLDHLADFGGLVSAIVKIAPLLGLLGTVSGMIDTFDALGDTTGGGNQGLGVAGGISEALFSTQMGLLVAIPGLLVGRLLDRRQHTLENELEKVKDVLATQHEEALA